MKPLWGYPFAPNSFFPNISLNDILEYEFQISYAMRIPFFHFDEMEFYEFIWFFERLAKQKKEESKSAATDNNLMLG